MLDQILSILSNVLLVAGSFFCVVGGIGILRLRDFYTRSHAAGLTDSAGAAMIIGGLAIQAGISLITFKLCCVWIFLWLTSPASTHALAKAAYARGVKAT